jgi:hypothetical protein
MMKVFEICPVFVCMIVHFHKGSLFETILVILNQHNSVVFQLMVEVQDLMVIDEQSEMVLYHCHVVVVKCKHIQQGIQMIRLKLEKKETFYFRKLRDLKDPFH